MKKFVILVAAFGVALVLTACGTSGESGASARTIAGQVEDYDGLAGILEAENSFDDLVDVGEGSIRCEWKFHA